MPTLPPQTFVIGLRMFRKIKPGDIVIFTHGGLEKIKRVQRVQNDNLFVVGDSPEDSKDSRHFGEVENTSVLAKVIWPRPTKDT